MTLLLRCWLGAAEKGNVRVRRTIGCPAVDALSVRWAVAREIQSLAWKLRGERDSSYTMRWVLMSYDVLAQICTQFWKLENVWFVPGPQKPTTGKKAERLTQGPLPTLELVCCLATALEAREFARHPMAATKLARPKPSRVPS